MTERDILIKKISTYQFAIDDMRLYLDTHPMDMDTVSKAKEYSEKLKKLTETYEEKFGALFKGSGNSNRWSWIRSPWPWECEEAD